jgi:hypothetical protein
MLVLSRSMKFSPHADRLGVSLCSRAVLHAEQLRTILVAVGAEEGSGFDSKTFAGVFEGASNL